MNKLKIIDATQGHLHISKNKKKYFKTKDSASPSGHSLLAQIDMTHAGIVTRNYGFYLPSRMKAGAHTFTKDYAKPLLIGHDEDTTPVGRVVQSDYVDTSSQYKVNDSYIRDLYAFEDAKKKGKDITDIVRYVIREYDGSDGYQGLGHIRGLVKITDPKVIEGVLDETFLTVSTSMVSDSATCSICGTDWVRDGLCEHGRGQVYDDNVCVVIPGEMSYDHLGIVNTPADPHAHDFFILSDNPEENIELKLDKTKDIYKTSDHYDVAAQLFAYNDRAIVSLSSETNVNLIDIKDNIQKMENAMKLEGMNARIKDALDIKVEVYRYSNPTDGEGSKEVTVREYMEDLDEKALQKMISQIAGMVSSDKAEVSDESLKTIVDKYCTETFELIDATKPAEKLTDSEEEEEEEDLVEDKKKCKKKKKAKKMGDNLKLEEGEEITEDDMAKELLDVKTKVTEEKISFPNVIKKDEDSVDLEKIAEIKALLNKDDVLTVLTYGEVRDSIEGIADILYDIDRSKLSELDGKAIYEMMCDHLSDETRLNEEKYKELKASDFCGMKGCFPVVDKQHYLAAKKSLGLVIASDSVKSRILTAIEKKAKKLELDLTDNFDNKEETCNNNDDVNVEELVQQFEDARSKLEKQGIEIPGLESKDDFSDKDQEIEILEAQLEAANEELDALTVENKGLKTNLLEELATRTVDMKLLSGNFEINDRVVEIEDHKKRSLDSLKDGIKDLESTFKIQDFISNDGMAQAPIADVEDPTLKQDDKTAGSAVVEKNVKEDKYKLYDDYNKRVATYGKMEADKWLTRIQRQNGSVQTID